MAKLEKRGLSLEIKNIKALYGEGDNINSEEDYSYEVFDISFKINNKDIPDINGTYELCSENISMLIDSINYCLKYHDDINIEFEEPNFSFELKYIDDKYIEFITWGHDNSFSNGSYGDTAIGFRFVIEWQILVAFEQQLEYEFNHKKRLPYEDYLEKQRNFYEED